MLLSLRFRDQLLTLMRTHSSMNITLNIILSRRKTQALMRIPAWSRLNPSSIPSQSVENKG